MITSIPICFYPMRKLIIDDDQEFLHSMLLKVYEKNFSVYSSPRKILHHLLKEYKPVLTKADLVSLDTAVEATQTKNTINIQIEKLKKMLLKPPHQDISVLLVDYHMPEMLGLDFLKEISHLPMKKALVTGEKNYEIGIKAFNDGLVDAYIRKDDIDFSQKIKNIISELEWKYFVDLSSTVLDIPELNILKNNSLVSVFKKFFKDFEITSFCLTGMQGDFIAQGEKGEQVCLIVRSKKQLHELAKIAKEDGGSIDTIMNLEQGTVIPYFNGKEFWEIPAKEWDEYLYKANTLASDPDIVWASTKNDTE